MTATNVFPRDKYKFTPRMLLIIKSKLFKTVLLFLMFISSGISQNTEPIETLDFPGSVEYDIGCNEVWEGEFVSYSLLPEIDRDYTVCHLFYDTHRDTQILYTGGKLEFDLSKIVPTEISFNYYTPCDNEVYVEILKNNLVVYTEYFPYTANPIDNFTYSFPDGEMKDNYRMIISNRTCYDSGFGFKGEMKIFGTPKVKHFQFYENNGDYQLLEPEDDSMNKFKIAADGAKGSIFTVSGNNTRFRIKEDPNGGLPEEYGKFEEYGTIEEERAFTYTHPRFSPESSNPTFQLEIIDDQDNVLEEVELEVYRPPYVILTDNSKDIIGINLSLALSSNPRYQYDGPSLPPLPIIVYVGSFTNHLPVQQEILRVLQNMRGEQKIAISKVDVIGIGLGGLAARAYLQNPSYEENVNKLITVSTPHAGTRLANFFFDPNVISPNLCSYTPSIWCPPNMDRLMTGGSSFVNSLLNGGAKNRNVVPSHAITTYVDYEIHIPLLVPSVPEYDPSSNKKINLRTAVKLNLPGLLQESFLFFTKNLIKALNDDIFLFQQNDGFSSMESQRGGLPLNASTELKADTTEFLGLVDAYQNDLKETILNLLKIDPEDNLFSSDGFYPPVNLLYQTPTLFRDQEISSLVSSESISGNISIQMNSSETSLELGDTLAVTMYSASATHFIALLNSGDSTYRAEIKTPDSLSVIFPVDSTFIGKRYFIGVAFDSITNSFAIDTLSFFVDNPEIPDSISVSPEDLRLFIEESKAISTRAYFPGYSMLIDESPNIQLTSLNPNITSTNTQIVTGIEEGIGNIEVSYKGKKDTLNVSVLGYPSCFMTTDAFISDMPLPSGDYSAGAQLEATSVIEQGNDVIFNATERIHLLPGFEVKQGATFKARIANCETPPANR